MRDEDLAEIESDDPFAVPGEATGRPFESRPGLLPELVDCRLTALREEGAVDGLFHFDTVDGAVRESFTYEAGHLVAYERHVRKPMQAKAWLEVMMDETYLDDDITVDAAARAWWREFSAYEAKEAAQRRFVRDSKRAAKVKP